MAGSVGAGVADRFSDLLTDVVLLVQTYTDAGISGFRETLEQRRPAIDPPIT